MFFSGLHLIIPQVSLQKWQSQSLQFCKSNSEEKWEKNHFDWLSRKRMGKIIKLQREVSVNLQIKRDECGYFFAFYLPAVYSV